MITFDDLWLSHFYDNSFGVTLTNYSAAEAQSTPGWPLKFMNRVGILPLSCHEFKKITNINIIFNELSVKMSCNVCFDLIAKFYK